MISRKSILVAISLLVMNGPAFAEVDLSVLSGDTGQVTAPEKAANRATTPEGILDKVDKMLSVSCPSENMCEFYKADSANSGFRFRVNIGQGNDYGNNNGGGFAIYNGNNGGDNQYYGFTAEYVKGKSVCRQYINKSIMAYVQTMVEILQTKEFVKDVMTAQAKHDDSIIVVEPIKIALATLATLIKPNAGNCSSNSDNNSFNRY